VPFNAALLARPRAPRNPARRLPTPEQARVLMAAVGQRDPEFELLVRLGAATGLRRGEVVALSWYDLDLDGAELSVSGNVLFVRGLAGGFVRKGPKSEHGDRVAALDARTVELLRRHRARRAEGALAAGVSLAEDSYLLTRVPDGARPIRPEAMTRRFSRLAASLGHDYTSTACGTSRLPSSAWSPRPPRCGSVWATAAWPCPASTPTASAPPTAPPPSTWGGFSTSSSGATGSSNGAA
jgi:integrase